MNYSEILKKAPRYISTIYNSLNSYVWETLFSNDYRSKVLSRFETPESRKGEYAKMKAMSEEATLLVFIFVLRKFFLEGSRMAKATVDELKTFGVKSFNFGKTCFSRRNRNVILGDILAQKLFSIIDNKARQLLLDKNQIYEILQVYDDLKKEKYG
jgi:hypothetical protein